MIHADAPCRTPLNPPLNRFAFVAIAIAMVLWIACGVHSASAQDVWEYSPYKVKVWLSVSPSLSLGASTQEDIRRKIVDHLEIQFGATWSVSVEQTPDALFGSVLQRLDELSVDHLLAQELILVVGKTEQAKQAFQTKNPSSSDLPNPKSKQIQSKAEAAEAAERDARAASLQSIRTLESAISRIKEIAIQPLQFAALQRAIVPYQGESQWEEFRGIVKPFRGSNSDLQDKLSSGEVTAALVQRMDLESFQKVARSIPTRLPWQPEALLKNNDKIFLVSVDRVGESIRVQVKELDAFLQRMSQTVRMEFSRYADIPRVIAQLARDCFSPLVRIEESDFKTALMRVRGAGLVTTAEHPVLIGPGDVVLPFIRRDDSSGNPTVLQSIPFTFIAVTERIDPVSKLYGAIFTANRGALTAAKNRRTQRIGLKVSPSFASSELKLRVQGVPDGVFRGAEVYRRTPGTEGLEMLGRTDWRGILSISQLECPTIQYEPPNESRSPTIANARTLATAPIDPPEYHVREASPPPAAGAAKEETPSSEQTASEQPASTQPANSDSAKEAQSVQRKASEKKYGEIGLNVPLYLYYIKNGDTLLARLPIVTGLQPSEQADLPDDRRRLETEAFLKGLQGEVLDLVVRRRILESRIKQKIKANDLPQAERLLNELKRVKSYEKMNEQIEGIQRRALSSEKGPVPPGIVKKIDKMVDTTRQMLQKYLQDSLVRDLELELNKSK